jgi:hypothetical protein
MKSILSHPVIRKDKTVRYAAVLLWLAIVTGLIPLQRIEAAPQVVLWDTASPLSETLNLEDRPRWKAVPHELLALESDPPKASSDPGYYGREYAFKGDAIVECRSLAVAFSSLKGRVLVYLKDQPGPSGDASTQTAPLGRKLVEFVPSPTRNPSAAISRLEIIRNTDNEVTLQISFAAPGAPEVSSQFTLDKTGLLEIKPDGNMKAFSLLGALEYGILPSFVGDDLIFNPVDYPSANALSLPSGNLFLGLVQGEDSELVLTWPTGKQQMKLQLGPEQAGKRLIESLDFEPDGQSLYLSLLGAPGIWHREKLTPNYLEKEVTLQWKRPFPARWKTQLYEEGLKTTYTVRAAKGQIWRGVPGSYTYPVWFNGDRALYFLSKKVPPKGESLLYFLEGQETPLSVSTPVDIMKAALGRPMSNLILDFPGRKLRTHHRRGAEGVRRACTCGCTEAIQAVFEAGAEVDKKNEIQEALEDMIYFVHRHVERIDEYQRFAEGVIQLLQATSSASPELKPFLDELSQIAQRIPQEYATQKENMKSFAYVDELTRRTLALTSRKDSANLKAYMDLLKAWRDMGGAQDYVLAQCHTITRRLLQAAGYGCVTQPKAVAAADEVIRRCRQCLRNPDGYEIWANY